MGPIRPQGQVMGGMATPYGPTSTATDIASGIASFMQQFRAAQDLEKERNWNDFQRDIQMINMGMPVDQKQVVRHAKGAGLPIDFNGPTKSQVQQRADTLTQQDQGAEMMTRMAQGVQIPQLQFPPSGVGIGIPPVAGQATQGAPAPARQPAPLPISQGEQWVNQLMGQAAMMQQMKMMEHNANIGKLNLFLGAISDNPQLADSAIQTMQKLGIVPQLEYDAEMRLAKMSKLNPEDVAQRLLWAKTGGPQLTNSIMEYYSKNADRVQAQKKEIADEAVKIMEQYPGVTMNVALAYATGFVTGDQKLYLQAASAIHGDGTKENPGLKTKGRLEWEKSARDETRANENLKVQQGNLGVRQQELGVQRQRLSLDQQTEARQLATSSLMGIMDLMKSKDIDKNKDSMSTLWKNWSDSARKLGINVYYNEEKSMLDFLGVKPTPGVKYGGAEGSVSLQGTQDASKQQTPGWFGNLQKGWETSGPGIMEAIEKFGMNPMVPPPQDWGIPQSMTKPVAQAYGQAAAGAGAAGNVMMNPILQMLLTMGAPSPAAPSPPPVPRP